MPTTETRGPTTFRNPNSQTPEQDQNSGSNGFLSPPAVALLAAGAIGFAVGAVIWNHRRVSPSRFGSFDRAVDIARSGAVDTVKHLRRRLREEGYSPAQIEGRAKKYLASLIETVRDHT